MLPELRSATPIRLPAAHAASGLHTKSALTDIGQRVARRFGVLYGVIVRSGAVGT